MCLHKALEMFLELDAHAKVFALVNSLLEVLSDLFWQHQRLFLDDCLSPLLNDCKEPL